MRKVNTTVKIGSMTMKNPVTTASGTFGSGLQMTDYVDLNRLGAITIKGTTLEARSGNMPPRIIETPAGIVASVGLENPGVDFVLSDIIPKIAGYNSPIIVNIGGSTVEDYGEVARRLNSCKDIDAIEVNISCPNVKSGGMTFGTDPKIAGKAVAAVRKNTDKTLIVKLTPSVTDITLMARVARDNGAEALTLINAYPAMAIDIIKKKPALGNIMGGLCGPALKPIALRLVYLTAQAVDLPIIGVGGIVNWRDAVEFLLAGATGVAVGTGNFLDPSATMKIVDGVEQYLIDNGFDDIHDIIGLAWR
jgi:dihydroorotate dehydrogenase (NAD+) catalytic subunit